MTFSSARSIRIGRASNLFCLWSPRTNVGMLCALAIVVRWPWLGVLAFLFGDELDALYRKAAKALPAAARGGAKQE